MTLRSRLAQGARTKLFRVGAILAAVGTLPLLTVVALAWLGVTSDPNPNPIGFGILYMFVGQTGIVLMLIAVGSALLAKKL